MPDKVEETNVGVVVFWGPAGGYCERDFCILQEPFKLGFWNFREAEHTPRIFTSGNLVRNGASDSRGTRAQVDYL